jgi:hypothetical protein
MPTAALGQGAGLVRLPGEEAKGSSEGSSAEHAGPQV